MKTLICKPMLAIALPLALAFFPQMLKAQSGRMSGQAPDASQAAIPGATLTLDNPVKGDHRQVLTDSASRYSFPDLPIGRYNVRTEKTGFQSQVKTSVEINVGAAISVDFSYPQASLRRRYKWLPRRVCCKGATPAA